MNSQLIRKYEAMGFDKGQMEKIGKGWKKGWMCLGILP